MAGCKVTAILMAAGMSRRMGDQDKLLLPYRGRPLLEHTLALIQSIPFHQRLLVITPTRLASIRVSPGVRVILNFHPERGQSESLRLGVEHATGDAYMFFTGDQPLLDHASVGRLLLQADDTHIVFPTVMERPCVPAIFPAKFRSELLNQQGDTGGREIRQAHPEACLPLEAADPRPFLDVDSPEDYRRLIDSLHQ